MRTARLPSVLAVLALASCSNTGPPPAATDPGERIGSSPFAVACSPGVQPAFNRGVALLHSFWYEAAEEQFRSIAASEPECAMAYWGVAMTAFHPLWPDQPDYEKGRQAVERARAARVADARERTYIEAVAQVFSSGEATYDERKAAFERAMAALQAAHPEDVEAAIFHALALIAIAPPTDQTLARQKEAAAILDALAPRLPQHPGVLHYTIHAYDAPGHADRALAAARRYPEVASSVPHGLHMSSHIFTRLGLWSESVAMNHAASAEGHHFAQQQRLGGAWDEELHAVEYLVYAHLQLADDRAARRVIEELRSHPTVAPLNLKGVFPFAASPARLALERRDWREAATLQDLPAELPWDRFPFARAQTLFARAVGAARLGDVAHARAETVRLAALRDGLSAPADAYWAGQIDVLRLEASAWTAAAEGRAADAESELRSAVQLEESMAKHPVTPGPVIPAREQLADLLLEHGQPARALDEFRRVLEAAPNRFNALYGAGRAALALGHDDDARRFFQLLVDMCRDTDSERAELLDARRRVESATSRSR